MIRSLFHRAVPRKHPTATVANATPLPAGQRTDLVVLASTFPPLAGIPSNRPARAISFNSVLGSQTMTALHGWQGVRFCGWCKRRFEPSRPEQLYCNATHKKAAQRARGLRSLATVVALLLLLVVGRGLAQAETVTLTNHMQTVPGVIVNRVSYAITPDQAPPTTYSGVLDSSFNAPGGTATVNAPPLPGKYWIHLRYEYDGPNDGPNRFAAARGALRVALAGFYTVTPCRLFDTRTVGGALTAGTLRTYAVNELCDIPSGVGAIAANITVTQPTSAGRLTIFPAGTPEPQTSSINYRAGQTRANNAILPLGPQATFTVACRQQTGSVHFILDVVGYFETPPVMPPGESSSNAVVIAALAALGALAGAGGYWLHRKRAA